jgi:hypothetical protein
MDRRTFFADTMKTAVLLALMENTVSLEEVWAADDKSSSQGPSQQFWGSFFDDVDPTKPHVIMRDAAQPVPEHVDPDKVPRFFHYDDQNGLRFAENIDRSELPKIQGGALVSLSLSGFHPSSGDAKKIGEAAFSQIQVHAVQTTPIAQYIAPLSWVTLASIMHGKGQATKLPTVDQLNFMSQDETGATSSVSHILYPKAEGKFAVNVTLPPRDSMLHKIIATSLKGAGIVAPLLSLPAISVPAIKAFTSFYNTLQQNAGFVINSPLKDAVASYDAVDSPNMHADALKLLTGPYIIVPSSSTDGLREQMNDLKLVNGYLVPKTLASNVDPLTAAQEALPDITYATLKVTVQPAIGAVTAETPNGGSPAAAKPN